MSESKHAPEQTPGRALVLSGGSIKGAYQIGAIVEVIERGFVPNAIYGISIGALNGGILASYVGEQVLAGQPPDLLAAARRLEKYWHDNVRDFKRLGHKRCLLLVLWEVLRSKFTSMIRVDGVIDIANKEIRNENLRAASEAGLKFFAGALNLTANIYVDAEGLEDQILDYIIASGMQPIVMPMRVIRPLGSKPPRWWTRFRAVKKPGYVDPEDSWVDGGVYNVTPLRPAIDTGYQEIVCIICQPHELERGSFQGRLLAIGERVTDVMTQLLMIKDMERTLRRNYWIDQFQRESNKSGADRRFLEEYKKVDLRIVRPAEELDIELETFNQSDIERLIEMGHRDAAAEMHAPPRQWTRDKRLGERAPSTMPSAAEAAERWAAR